MADSQPEYIKKKLSIIQRGKKFMNDLDSYHEYLHNEASDFEEAGHREYKFFRQNAFENREIKISEFKKLKKTIDSAFDKITVSKKAKSFIAEIFGNLDDKKNEMLNYPENRLIPRPSN